MKGWLNYGETKTYERNSYWMCLGSIKRHP
nr:MAG TPA: hypothetical protein [Bacteriophage sp.]